MYIKSKLLLLMVVALFAGVFYFGCEQPEDVLTSISRTDIYLSEERLPNNPNNMTYELWVANSTDSVSLGKFNYDFETREFMDGAALRADSNKFQLDEDIINYDVIFVSVETVPDDDAASPGPIMLIDYIASPTVKLRFPNVDSLWEGTVRYSMETPSDGMNSATDGYGIWFASYNQNTTNFNDTFLIGGVLDWSLTYGDSVFAPNCIEANVIYGLENITQKDTSVIFGLDTLTHTVVRFNVIESTKTCDYVPSQLTINYNVNTGSVTYDQFLQDNFALPDISPWGWKYKGWIVSTSIDESVTGEMTLPAWIIMGDYFAESAGGMFTTGTFSNITSADDANPYCASERTPNFPGEDFFQNLPGGLAPINFVPGTNNPGLVFISLEPINYLDTTNFPLIAFLDPNLPEDRTMVTNPAQTQQFTLRGWMHTNDPYRGFPLITVNINRY